MAKLRVCGVNHIDGTAVLQSGVGGVSGDVLPVANIKTTARDKVFRSQNFGLGQCVIQGHWGGDGRKASFAALFRHNLHGAKWQIILYSDANYTTQVYNSGAVDVYTCIALGSFEWGVDPLGTTLADVYATDAPAVLYFPAVSCGSFQIFIQQAGAAGPYAQITRAWLGNAFEATYNPEYGSGFGFASASVQTRTEGGSLRTRRAALWRVLELDLQWIVDSERPVWSDLVRGLDLGGDLFVSVYPALGGRDERDNTVAAKMIAMPQHRKWAYGLNSQPLALAEI